MLVSALEGHRLWAPSYDAAANPMVALTDRAFPEALAPVDGLRVADVACGTGHWAARLAESGARVIGLDLCEEMLARAAGKPSLRGRIGLADASHLPLAPDSVDLAVCSLAVGYLPDLDLAFAEFARVVMRGGRVAIADLHPARLAAGSTRSFSIDDSVYEMRHFAWSIDDILLAGHRAGLHLELQRDVCFGPAEEHFFRVAGMMDVFTGMSDVPAIWIAGWVRP